MGAKAIWGATYCFWFPRRCWACGAWTRQGRALLLDGELPGGFRALHKFASLLPMCFRCQGEVVLE